jgi:hypothetical protein
MDDLPGREDSGEYVYRKMVMVNVYGKPGKHGRLGRFGACRDLDGIGPATGHSIPCTSWMI